MIPPIRIQITGNTCFCCTEDNDPKEFRIVYRADKNIFVAVPQNQEIPMPSIVATREALNVILQERYFTTLQEVEPTSTPNSPISLQQIKRIESIASSRIKKSSSEEST